ncbi:hypothetical protein [Amphritea pacifica]|uniref:hypothetical protein n=1 Tax=Amphritea pacifica TaxID=2811233 RepID=UPI001962B037|nr:hypothetical protein [Amphritea pacifica]MBN1009161.1 hypothetical protein [Amphritea pacifica]
MQINFFTSPNDEKALFEFIRKKEGYFICDFFNPKKQWIDVLEISDLADVSVYRDLGVLTQDILPCSGGKIYVSDLRDKRGFPKVEVLEFTRSYANDGMFYPGRLWINGLKPETEKLYRSISGYIRRKFIDENGWYWGETAREFCAETGLSKAASTHL